MAQLTRNANFHQIYRSMFTLFPLVVTDSMNIGQPKSNKKPWTGDEDAALLALVKQYGSCGSWPAIALHMQFRSGKQCRERYINQLDPSIKKTMWTYEEDATIMRLHSLYGKKWSKFMDQLPGRSDNAIKNRYHIISRDNYTDHYQHSTQLKRPLDVEPELKLEEPSEVGPSPPESDEVRLERYQAVRDALDREIEALTQKRKLPKTEVTNDEEHAPPYADLHSLKLRKENDHVLDSLLLLQRGDSMASLGHQAAANDSDSGSSSSGRSQESFKEHSHVDRDPLHLLREIAEHHHQQLVATPPAMVHGFEINNCPFMNGSLKRHARVGKK